MQEDYAESDIAASENAKFEVGVDSGQAGLFDCSHYRDDRVIAGPENAINKNDPGALWYMHCCHITLTQMAAGVLAYGVVSSSGFGDGSYDCFYGRNDDGKSSALKSNTSRKRKMMSKRCYFGVSGWLEDVSAHIPLHCTIVGHSVTIILENTKYICYYETIEDVDNSHGSIFFHDVVWFTSMQ